MSVRNKSQAGFSLIELMIVVAIIGILATVAAPNFKRFMMQSKQGEVKQNLAAFYQAQRTFFDQWQIYPGQFAASGYRPEGMLNYRLTTMNNALGIAALVDYLPAGANIVACVTTDTTTSNGIICFPNDPNASATSWQESNTATQSTTPGCTEDTQGLPSTASSFDACGAALHSGVAVSDEWTINEEKRIVQVVNGIL